VHQRPAHNGALYIYSLRLYFACSPPAALASCTAARRVQDCDSRPPVLVRQAPGYLADDCPLVADARVRQLRSADTRTLVVSWMLSGSGHNDVQSINQSIKTHFYSAICRNESQAQDHKSGTVGRPISDNVGCHTASSGGY